MGFIEYFHPRLALIDYTQPFVKLQMIALSFIFCCCLYGCTTLFSINFKTYKCLRTKEKVFWNLAVVRGFFGIFCIMIGSWAIFIDTELVQDVVYATNRTSYFAMTATVGFFVFECFMTIWSDIYFKQFNKMLNLHHFLAITSYSLLLYFGCSHFFGTRAVILEMSTPFSCLCWTLLKANKAETFLWKANQFLLVHTFHLRSVGECFLWYQTYIHWDRIWSAMPMVMFISLYLPLILVTFIMTPYWTYKKTVQMIHPVDWNFEDANKNQTEEQKPIKKD